MTILPLLVSRFEIDQINLNAVIKIWLIRSSYTVAISFVCDKKAAGFRIKVVQKIGTFWIEFAGLLAHPVIWNVLEIVYQTALIPAIAFLKHLQTNKQYQFVPYLNFILTSHGSMESLQSIIGGSGGPADSRQT